MKSSRNNLPLRVLHVDDEPDLLEIMVDVLSEYGAVVETACNGEVAIQKIFKQTFDVVLSDISMPKMNGLELCHKILDLDLEEGQLPKVYLVTGKDSVSIPEDLKTLLSLEIITKPFNIYAVAELVTGNSKDKSL